MNQEALVRTAEYQKNQTETNTKAKIFTAEQQLTVQSKEGDLYEQQLKI